jgi:hypothetical protein
MKVSIGVWGRFHAFNLAQQLQKRESLAQLITTYPAFKAQDFGIDSKKVKSLIQLEILSRVWAKLPGQVKGDRNLQLFWLEWFDREVVKILEKNQNFDLFVGWAGACYWSIQKAKEIGAKTIIERGSSHMAYQTQILEEEHAAWGLKFTATHAGVY